MFSKILNWCFGYEQLSDIETQIDIPDDANYMLVIKGDGELEARKYLSSYKFMNIYFDELILPFNESDNIVYDQVCSKFDKLPLLEFIHLVLPNKNIEVNYVPIHMYMTGIKRPSMIDYFEEKEDYICTCKKDAKKCLYHKFLIENLYKKYKNGLSSENSNS